MEKTAKLGNPPNLLSNSVPIYILKCAGVTDDLDLKLLLLILRLDLQHFYPQTRNWLTATFLHSLRKENPISFVFPQSFGLVDMWNRTVELSNREKYSDLPVSEKSSQICI